MRILIADDELVSRCLLEELLTEWGHEVVACGDGAEALRALQAANGPKLAILDWQMPGMDGVEVCRRLRAAPSGQPRYLILLTVRQEKTSIITGLVTGANDYVTKPFDPGELNARVTVGIRMVELQQSLAQRIDDLENALAHIKTLQGILPICSYCKKVRNDENYWQQVDSYVSAHSDVLFTHAICPECKPRIMAAARREMGLPQGP